MNIKNIPKEIICKHIIPICDIVTSVNLSQTCRHLYTIIIENNKNIWNREIDYKRDPDMTMLQIIDGMNFFWKKIELINDLLINSLLNNNNLKTSLVLLKKNNLIYAKFYSKLYLYSDILSNTYEKVLRLNKELDSIEQKIIKYNSHIKLRLTLYFLAQFFDALVSSILVALSFVLLKDLYSFWNKSMYAAIFGCIAGSAAFLFYIAYRDHEYPVIECVIHLIKPRQINQTILYYIKLINKIMVASIYCILYFCPNILQSLFGNNRKSPIIGHTSPIIGHTQGDFKFKPIRN